MRVKGMFRPGDFPPAADEVTSGAVTELFGHMFPGVADPEIDENHVGMAIVAHNPAMALQMAKLSKLIALDTGFCQRADLRELAIQTVNLHYGSDYGFRTRAPIARAVGIGDDLLAALPDWRGSDMFNDEQRLVIAYAQAVVTGDVPADLFAQVVARYGEKGAVELTTLVAFWSAWAMILQAANPA
jgi:4-carboxymuconolactone decarboxylase